MSRRRYRSGGKVKSPRCVHCGAQLVPGDKHACERDRFVAFIREATRDRYTVELTGPVKVVR